MHSSRHYSPVLLSCLAMSRKPSVFWSDEMSDANTRFEETNDASPLPHDIIF